MLADAAGTQHAGSAANLRHDLNVVRTASETRWTTSPAEGQTGRLKTLERAMCGLAGFPLLRARVLHAA